jgi:hypothetical protein
MELYADQFPPDIAAIIARRPDLAPLDIHYVMNAMDYLTEDRPGVLATMKPVGIDFTLSTGVVSDLARHNLIDGIGGHDLENYEVVYERSHIVLRPRASGEAITYQEDELWRDLFLHQCELYE